MRVIFLRISNTAWECCGRTLLNCGSCVRWMPSIGHTLPAQLSLYPNLTEAYVVGKDVTDHVNPVRLGSRVGDILASVVHLSSKHSLPFLPGSC